VIVDKEWIKDSWKGVPKNGIMEYRLGLKYDQQIASGSMKLLQH